MRKVLDKLYLLNKFSDGFMAMGNSKGIVKIIKIEITDAAKYLVKRYEFND